MAGWSPTSSLWQSLILQSFWFPATCPSLTIILSLISSAVLSPFVAEPYPGLSYDSHLRPHFLQESFFCNIQTSFYALLWSLSPILPFQLNPSWIGGRFSFLISHIVYGSSYSQTQCFKSRSRSMTLAGRALFLPLAGPTFVISFSQTC